MSYFANIRSLGKKPICGDFIVKVDSELKSLFRDSTSLVILMQKAQCTISIPTPHHSKALIMIQLKIIGKGNIKSIH